MLGVGQDYVRFWHNGITATWHGNTYHHGVPVAKLPLDLWVFQEIIWNTKPDVIVECGVWQGGSALFYAGVLDAIGRGRVLALDENVSGIHNNAWAHPRIDFIRADSVAPDTVEKVHTYCEGKTVLVNLDSLHTQEHVRAELEAYADLVQPGHYMIVEDTSVNGHPCDPIHGPGPWEAVHEWLPDHPEFAPDPECEKFAATANPDGWLRRLPDRLPTIGANENARSENGPPR